MLALLTICNEHMILSCNVWVPHAFFCFVSYVCVLRWCCSTCLVGNRVQFAKWHCASPPPSPPPLLFFFSCRILWMCFLGTWSFVLLLYSLASAYRLLVYSPVRVPLPHLFFCCVSWMCFLCTCSFVSVACTYRTLCVKCSSLCFVFNHSYVCVQL